MDEALDKFEENLKNTKENINRYYEQNKLYRDRIIHMIRKIDNNRPFSDVDTKWIFNEFYAKGDDYTNMKIILSLEDVTKKLRQREYAIHIKIANKPKIIDNLNDLKIYIDDQKFRQKRYDTRDKQSMRNVIGISITVCVIVTLCIVLLIAVRNQNQTNAGVTLLNWV